MKPSMGVFEQHKLRDQEYRSRFEQKLAEIRNVRKEHTFIAYATNRRLIEELEQIYTENIQDYESCFLLNQQAFERFQHTLEDAQSRLHKARGRELQQEVSPISKLLEAEDYNLNAASKKRIEDSIEKLEQYQQEYTGWQEDLKAYRMQLKELMNQVWSEQFETYKRAYQHRKAEVIGDQLPTEAIRLSPTAVQAAIEERSQEVNRLLTKARKTPKYLPAAQAFQDSYASYEAFQQLEQDIDKSLQGRGLIRWVAVASFALLLAAGAYFGPDLYREYNEDNFWKKSKGENTYAAYRNYIDTYPEGKHVVKAVNAQMLLEYGEIPDFTDINGDIFAYEGALIQGKPEGKGTAVYENGDRYEGEWQGGIRTGIGSLTYANEDVYEGMWKFGKPEGTGTQTFANGDHYAGDWQKGKYHGRGTLNYADGSFYDGQWINGKMEGRGTFQSAENLKYSGNWKAGKRQGNGTQDYADGSTYIGNWQADERTGFGTVYFPDRSQFAGQWNQDRIQGQGIFTSKLRESFTGSFEGTTAQITLKDATGRVVRQGKWEGGLFLSY